MPRPPYTVLFDGRCRICTRSKQMLTRMRPTAPVQFVDVNDRAELAKYPQASGADTRGVMHVIDPAGHLTAGYDALVALAPIIPPVAWAGGILKHPLISAVGRRAYNWLAANRYRLGGQISCHNGACQIHL